MRYAVWLVFILAGSVVQCMLNNYLPAYLAPDVLLMLAAFVTFFYGYYAALVVIIMIAYASSVFSAGSVWSFIFSYVLVFYVLVFFKRLFDRSQEAAILVIASLATLLYLLSIRLVASFAGGTAPLNVAMLSSLERIPVNVACAYLIFRYLPKILMKRTPRDGVIQGI